MQIKIIEFQKSKIPNIQAPSFKSIPGFRNNVKNGTSSAGECELVQHFGG